MSATLGVSTWPVPLQVQEISLDRIEESKGNPRRIFDEAKLRELAESVKVHGVLQPVVVRPLPCTQIGHPHFLWVRKRCGHDFICLRQRFSTEGRYHKTGTPVERVV